MEKWITGVLALLLSYSTYAVIVVAARAIIGMSIFSESAAIWVGIITVGFAVIGVSNQSKIKGS